MKILMVCLGNICRSPLAEGILRSKISNKHFVDSAGTGNWHIDSLPDSRSIEVAQKYAIDITDQRARQFTTDDFQKFDWIFAMDQSNYNEIRKLARQEEDKEKVKLILNELNPGMNQKVPDPYYGDENEFEEVFTLLDQATDKIVKKYNLA